MIFYFVQVWYTHIKEGVISSQIGSNCFSNTIIKYLFYACKMSIYTYAFRIDMIPTENLIS